MRLQDMPRPWARRCLDIPRFCRATLGVDLRGATLVLAYSTGLDSTVLLFLMAALAPRLRLTIIPTHIHHGLRPESDQEAEHAQRTCTNLGLACIRTRIDVPGLCHARKQGIEETARAARYAFLEQVRLEHGADWIVTAHHSDDLLEDIVLRLLRGTGWPGLGGMVGVDHQRHVLRPLLNWNKEELRAWAQDCAISWREDASNASLAHTRNRIRAQLVPLMRTENPALSTSILHLWQQARLDEDYWRQFPAPTLASAAGMILPADHLHGAHPAQRLRWYKEVLDAMGPGQALAAQLMAVDAAWTECAYGRCLQFPGDKTATAHAHGIVFSRWPRRQNQPAPCVPDPQ